MSNLDDHPEPVLSEDGPDCVARPVRQSLPAREAQVGAQTVRRLLPHRERRLVGAWCFLNHYGPTDVSGLPGMGVGAHPHMGLQTVTWLFDGDVLHHDSLGNQQTIRPGQLNLMTAGNGIAHAEVSPPRICQRCMACSSGSPSPPNTGTRNRHLITIRRCRWSILTASE